MTEVILLRSLGDLCLYFAVVGAFPLFFTHDFMLLYPALLGAAGVGVGAWLEKRGSGLLKYAALLLPLSALLLADETMEYLILVPVLIYTGALLWRGIYDLDYYGFREQFLNVGRVLLAFALLILAMYNLEVAMDDGKSSFGASDVLLYSSIYGFAGVFTMRMLRLGSDSTQRDRLNNNLHMIAVLVLILALSAMTVAMENVLHEILSWLLQGIFILLAFAPMLIYRVMTSFVSQTQNFATTTGETGATETGETVAAVGTAGQETAEAVLPQGESFPWWIAVLILAVLCGIVIFLMGSLKRGSGAAGSVGEFSDAETPEGRGWEFRRTNRSKVRKFYRSYLKLIRRKGQKLETDQTTADILERCPENTNTEAAAELRRIYLKARYDLVHPVTDREVEQAKAALKQVTDDNKAK